jgi:hypothetical protein
MLSPHGIEIVDKDDVGPPQNKVGKVLKGLNPLYDENVTGKMEKDCKQENEETVSQIL